MSDFVTIFPAIPIRRTCRECGAKLVLAITLDEAGLVENNDCPECGSRLRPLTPSERERVEEAVNGL